MPTIHKNAKLTPKMRKEIHEAPGSLKELAEKYHVHVNTIRKWKRRTDFNDRSSCRKKICLTLTEFEEVLICEVKKLTLFSIDDLTYLLKPYIPHINRDNLYKCLRRHGLKRNDLILPAEHKKEKHKPFKDYEPGYLHIDVKHLPKIKGEQKYLFVAIDRKTRIAANQIYERKDAQAAVHFLKYCQQVFPFKITTVLTDNGQCFTDRFAKGRKTPSGKHVFDKACLELSIEHRLTKPFSLQTNVMVERMNGRFNENVLKPFTFSSYQHLQQKLNDYIYQYNYFIKQKALGYLSPIQFYQHYCKKDTDEPIENEKQQTLAYSFLINSSYSNIHNHQQLDI